MNLIYNDGVVKLEMKITKYNLTLGKSLFHRVFIFYYIESVLFVNSKKVFVKYWRKHDFFMTVPLLTRDDNLMFN